MRHEITRLSTSGSSAPQPPLGSEALAKEAAPLLSLLPLPQRIAAVDDQIVSVDETRGVRCGVYGVHDYVRTLILVEGET